MSFVSTGAGTTGASINDLMYKFHIESVIQNIVGLYPIHPVMSDDYLRRSRSMINQTRILRTVLQQTLPVSRNVEQILLILSGNDGSLTQTSSIVVELSDLLRDCLVELRNVEILRLLRELFN